MNVRHGAALALVGSLSSPALPQRHGHFAFSILLEIYVIICFVWYLLFVVFGWEWSSSVSWHANADASSDGTKWILDEMSEDKVVNQTTEAIVDAIQQKLPNGSTEDMVVALIAAFTKLVLRSASPALTLKSFLELLETVPVKTNVTPEPEETEPEKGD
jgi:hypothetical protein